MRAIVIITILFIQGIIARAQINTSPGGGGPDSPTQDQCILAKEIVQKSEQSFAKLYSFQYEDTASIQQLLTILHIQKSLDKIGFRELYTQNCDCDDPIITLQKMLITYQEYSASECHNIDIDIIKTNIQLLNNLLK